MTVTPNVLGFFLNTALMVTIAKFQTSDSVKHRTVLFCVVVLIVFSVVATLSRMSIVGLILGSGTLILLRRRGTKNFGMILAGTVALVTVLILIGGPVYRNVLVERYSAILDPEEAVGFGKRLYIWFDVAADIFADNPITGTGVGGFVSVSTSYGASKLKSPHNLYVYVLAEFGLMGLLFFGAIVAGLFKLSIDSYKHIADLKDRTTLLGLLMCIFLYGLQGLTINFILREHEIWILLGLTLSAFRIFQETKLENTYKSASEMENGNRLHLDRRIAQVKVNK
jgi:O-antigen ligase